MAKKKDPRYKTIRIMLLNESVDSFQEIFKVLPRSVVAGDMHTNNNRFYRLVLNPGEFTFNEVQRMAKLIGCRYSIIRDLVEKEMRPRPRSAKKKPDAKEPG